MTRPSLSLVLCVALIGAGGCTREREEKALEVNRELSQDIDDLAERLDLYAANRRLSDEPNRSRLVLYNGFAFTEGGERRYIPRLGLKLHLPNLQEKLQVNFTSYDEDAEERGINASRYQPAASDDAVYGSSLALFQELGKVTTEFRPRVEYLQNEVQTSYLFKFASEARRGGFAIEPELQLFGRSDTGTGQFFALNFELAYGEEDVWTILNEEEYTDGDNTMRTNHGVRWDHRFDDIYSLRSSLVFESNNRETYHHDRFVLATTFGHRWRPNVLHYSVTPYFAFEKARRFRPRAGGDFRVDIIF